MTGRVAFDDTVARAIATMYTNADVVQQRCLLLLPVSARQMFRTGHDDHDEGD